MMTVSGKISLTLRLLQSLRYDTEPKVPLSPNQEESLLFFVKSDKVYYKYYDELIILLGIGFRVSDFCRLTERYCFLF